MSLSLAPMSFAQQRLWFLHRMQPESPAYNVPASLRLRGRLDARALVRALAEIVRRHEVLRTTYGTSEGEPVQVIGPAPRLRMPHVDLGGGAPVRRRRELDRLSRREARRPFDLARGPVLRTLLIAAAPADHVLLLTVHHIAFDGWSAGVVIGELGALYEAFRRGRPSPLPELEIQYADYAHWQREELSGTRLEAELEHWRERLAGVPALLDVPGDRPRSPVQSFAGGIRRFTVGAATSARLRALARERRATPFMVLLAAFAVLLHRYTGQRDLVIGTPVANRGRGEIEGLIGLFVNTVALRTRIPRGEPVFVTLVDRVREVALDAFAHQELPFERLVEELRPERSLSHSPLLQVLFGIQRSARAGLELSELTVEPSPVDGRTIKMDLELDVVDRDGGFAGTLGYSTARFDATTAERMVRQLTALLEGLLERPERPVSAAPMQSAAERHHLLAELNATAQGTRPDAAESVDRRILAAAACRPDAVAVECAGDRCTYRGLERRSAAVARRLAELGIAAEDRVGVLLERGPGLIESLLGTWRAGAAYVPLDPIWPEERVASVLAAAGARAVITGPGAGAAWRRRGVEVVEVGRESLARGEREPGPAPPEAPAERLAYVIYTSGSTGEPKGVMVGHRALGNYLTWCVERYPVGEGRGGAPVHSSVAFDLTVTSLFAPLVAGETAVVIPEGSGLPGLAAAMRAPGGYGFLKVTPSHLELLNQALAPAELAGAARALILGGETLFVETLASWLRHAPATRLINEYGPTEATVGCCVYELGGGRAVGPRGERGVPIGRAVSGLRMYVLDSELRPVVPGVVGELCIGGAGLARGYLGSPARTAAAWRPDPFGEPGGRFYRTGDLGRWRPAEAVLEFLGRTDRQVKLRGYRIELEEIESALKACPGVAEAVVELREVSGEKGLAAYLVGTGGVPPEAGALRGTLRASLPAYMVPTWFVPLERLPLAPGGKVDRRRLPDPQGRRPEAGGAGGRPTSEIEQRIAGVWRRVLAIERVGLDDNFFDLGGHSMLLLRVQRDLAAELGLPVALVDLFRHPTVAALAGHLGGAADEGAALDSVRARAARQRRSLARQRDRRPALAEEPR